MISTFLRDSNQDPLTFSDGINMIIQPVLVTTRKLSRKTKICYISKFLPFFIIFQQPFCHMTAFYYIICRQELYIDVGNKKHQEVQVTSLDDCIKGIDLETDLESTGGTLFCVKNEFNHVPQTCHVSIGSPIFFKDFLDVPQQTLVKGLVLATQDCTFTLALNVSQHYNWINSVVFG